MMKRRICILLMVLSGITSLTAQNMKSVFVAMPDSLTPLLTRVNKEDCIDFLESNMKAVVKNRVDNEAEMKVLTDDYLLMQTSAVGTLEMKLLPLNDSVKVVCMVRTVCASACDSEVKFYSSDWKEELDARALLTLPAADAFFLPGDSLSEEAQPVRKMADMNLMKASLSQEDTSLTFVYTTPDYLSQEDREKLSSLLRKEPLVRRWTNGKYQ